MRSRKTSSGDNTVGHPYINQYLELFVSPVEKGLAKQGWTTAKIVRPKGKMAYTIKRQTTL